jgi:hypothetical protein
MRSLANLPSDFVGLEHVGAIGEVQVVRFGSAQRQDRDLVGVLFNVGVVDFGEDPGTHGSAKFGVRSAELRKTMNDE